MNRRIIYAIMGCLLVLPINAQKTLYQADAETGALMQLSLENDTNEMNWILRTDKSQYPWADSKYGWGLGFFSIDGKKYSWEKPASQSNGVTEYLAGDISVSVRRSYKGDDLVETYTLKNVGSSTLALEDIGINTPFNDNYPDAATCMTSRCNAHIWAGGSATYVNAMRMSGKAPHLGLVLTEGSIKSYEVAERSRETGQSNFRGIITFNPENLTLKPKESYTLSWTLFAHTGWSDFKQKLLQHNSVFAQADKYVYEKGDEAIISFLSNHALKKPKLSCHGKAIPLTKESSGQGTLKYTATMVISELGNHIVELTYDGGKKTCVELLAVSNYDAIVSKRAGFILNNQQMRDKADKRFGAYMVYDNETNQIYLNDTPNCNPVDRDEGRERLGMGVLLAMVYNAGQKEESLKNSLLDYAGFVHRLQDKEYNTFSNTDLEGWNRNYNYSWVANFYFEMFGVTGDKQYLLDGYYTLKALYRNFGHGFYAIDMPTKGYALLKTNGLTEEAASLLEDFKMVADSYIKTGYHYPKSEVNYEQSIVAPSIIHLLRVYQLTKDPKYLEGAKEQLPLLESFGGFQPSYHLNDISIRHWDGYWFGKSEFWGDTFPHYWSTLTAVAYDLFAECTGDQSYRKRAENIVRNNLCLFTEDGRGSCAYIYPYKVDGKPAQFYDPYANDQDWALCFYMQIIKKSLLVQTQEKYIYNGIPWFDDNGKIVNAHGACILEEDGRYYLFGEWKSDESNAFPGFSCYSSDDLVNWKFENVVLPMQKEGILGPNRVGERVKVMKCPSTGEFVMYMHCDDMGYYDPHIGYATCRTINGDYEFHGALLHNGEPIKRWDMGTFQDADGKGYLLIHHGIIYRLSNDYRAAEAKILHGLPGSGESPAVFRKGGLYYMLYSGLTSWEKNDNFYFTASCMEGPWTKQGLFAPKGSLTHNSQSTFVFPLVRENDTIPLFMGDRWSYPHQASAATYVWLPLQVDGEKITIPQYWSCWDIETVQPVDPLAKGRRVAPEDILFGNKLNWQVVSGKMTSNLKGSYLEIPFRGTQIAVVGETNNRSGYAQVTLTNKTTDEIIISSLVDFYSKNPDNAIRYLSPKVPEGNYTLKIEVTGISPTWTDKSKTIFGSTDSFVAVKELVVFE